MFVKVLNQLEFSPNNVVNLKEIAVLTEKISKVIIHIAFNLSVCPTIICVYLTQFVGIAEHNLILQLDSEELFVICEQFLGDCQTPPSSLII